VSSHRVSKYNNKTSVMQRVQPSPNLKATVREGAKEIYVATHRKGHDVKKDMKSPFLFSICRRWAWETRKMSSLDPKCHANRKESDRNETIRKYVGSS
jgi:hypothetical protein